MVNEFTLFNSDISVNNNIRRTKRKCKKCNEEFYLPVDRDVCSSCMNGITILDKPYWLVLHERGGY